MFHSSLAFGFFLEIVMGQPHGISAQAQADMQPKTQWLNLSRFLEVFSI